MTTAMLERILNDLRDSETELSIAHTELKQCDDETQDILHDMELNSHTYHERAQLASKLVEVRQKRRVAKNTIELLQPLATWINANAKPIQQLKTVLGDMRKIDVKQANRQYYPKTSSSSERVRQ